MQVFADADWAGCATTRQSTTGVIVQLLNSTIHRRSKTQSILATSAGGSALYALGTATVVALHQRAFLIEAQFATRVRITTHTHTDSTAAKSNATRHGTNSFVILLARLFTTWATQTRKRIGTDPSDPLTKLVLAETLHRLFTDLDYNPHHIALRLPILAQITASTMGIEHKPLHIRERHIHQATHHHRRYQ